MDIIYSMCYYFIIYSFIGWCCEVGYAACELGKFVNRGFLNGPICPIYGCGALLITSFLKPVSDNIFLLFICSVILTSVLEYVTGWVLEKFFHQKWWDYTDMPFNISGYVCLKFSLLWGIACVFVVDIIHPLIEKLVSVIPNVFGIVLICILMAAFISDLILTIIAVAKLPKKLRIMDEIGVALHTVSDKIGLGLSGTVLNAKEKNDKIKDKIDEKKPEFDAKLEKYKNELSKNKFIHNRLMKAFPDLQKNQAFERLKTYYDNKRKK